MNSIKTARRLDGLLRALGFFSRAIHGDLPQRQRLKALDTFKSSPQGVLVATDVAARGLDIAKITSVIHYDIARSPQVYIHRSGRTARAFASGVTISLVTPEETSHHETICQYVMGNKSANANAKLTSMSSSSGVEGGIEPYKVELQYLQPLRVRVKLAKRVSLCV